MGRIVNYLGFKVLNVEYTEARKSFLSGSVLTISPNSYGLSTVNKGLDEALKRDGLLVLDGVYFGLGYFLRTLRTIKKNQGPDIFYQELEIQQKNSGRVFFLGASEQTLARMKERLNNEYPSIQCDTYSPPFKSELDNRDNEEISRRINNFKPNVVFVGMTCPKQEIWVHQNIHNHKDILFVAIGGVFDWFAGNRKELHPLWWKLRLGWLGRILQRPEILKRNLKFILIYIKDMFK